MSNDEWKEILQKAHRILESRWDYLNNLDNEKQTDAVMDEMAEVETAMDTLTAVRRKKNFIEPKVQGKKVSEMGNYKDKRAKPAFFLWGFPDKEGNFQRPPKESPFIPKGVTNTLKNIVMDGEVVGDIQIGSDGFIEGMMWLGGHIAKIKSFPTDDDVLFNVH